MSQSYEEMLQYHQEGRITLLQFIMTSEYNAVFLDWCKEKATEPSEESAQLFLDELEHDMEISQTYPIHFEF